MRANPFYIRVPGRIALWGFFCLFLLCMLILCPVYGSDKALSSDEARLDIYVAGKEIGQEKYAVEVFEDSIHSKSNLNFRDPGRENKRVRIETELIMNRDYIPQSYQLQTDIDGRKVTMAGKFVKGQANFEYRLDGIPRKRGLFVGEHYTLLDTNVFHHFTFIVQRFAMASNKLSSMEVIIPQELSNGILKVIDAGIEETSLRGKKRNLRRLKVDSGALIIDLWVDEHNTLHKIELPVKGIEVVRFR